MSTQIKRLYQNSKAFVPITLAEAVVVNTDEVPGLSSLGITTLEKVLKNTLSVVAANRVDIGTLQTTVNNINAALEKKQDTLTAGSGITISPSGVISVTGGGTGFSYKIVSQLPTASSDCENIVYLLPNSKGPNGNIFTEYICIKNNNTYIWEQIGTVTTDISLDDYLTKAEFYSVGITAQNVTNSSGTVVTVDYNIPSTLYDE